METKTKTSQELTPSFNDDIKGMIHNIRGVQVMLDSDVAKLYGYETKVLNQTANRNSGRFPDSFRFQLTRKEYVGCLRSQFVTLNISKQGEHKKYLPYVYTEKGIAMLAGLLKSEIAISISIKIIEAFVEFRKILTNYRNDYNQIAHINHTLIEHDKKFEQVFSYMEQNNQPKEGIIYKNQFYEAYSFLINLIKSASSSIIIIDNYMDSFILELICKNTKADKTVVTSKKLKLESLQNVDNKIKVVHNDSFHDRYVIIDDKEVYVFGASLKDLGNKVFTIFKLEDTGVFLDTISRVTK
jgi:phage regulator Rha-like protein